MFKLVVLCAIFAAAVGKPDVLFAPPITQYSTYLTPGATTITRQDSSVIHPSPLIYQAPLAYSHFIKKRSPQFPLAYSAPATYYPNYYTGATYNAPLIQSSSILPHYQSVSTLPAVHLIKKRSAPLFPATYAYTPTTYAATSPIWSSSYIASAPAVYSHAPLISQPLAYSHLIKKRSAGLLAYPAAYSSQSRFDLKTTPYSSISYTAPITYSSPIAYSAPFAHLYK